MTFQSDRTKPPPAPPAKPDRQVRPLTDTEVWYLKSFLVLFAHFGRAPNIIEFTSWIGMSQTPGYLALRRIETKGYLKRSPESKRFMPTALAAPYQPPPKKKKAPTK